VQANSGLQVANRAQKQDKDRLHKPHDELIARFALAQSRSGDAIKPIEQKFAALRKENLPKSLRKQFSLNNLRATPAGCGIWQLMAQSGEANKSVSQESLRRWSSAATVLIWAFLGLHLIAPLA
jgi:hypothetical protein